jgi:dihydroxyacetone kinase-like predicted kinase
MSIELQQQHIRIINQLFELEKKLSGKEELVSLQRHVDRIKNTFEEIGLQVLNPQGESYNETRTDCTASISGTSISNLFIVNVIKPIVYEQQKGSRQLLQKGVVVVESKK